MKIGWIGAGIMGLPMIGHLMNEGFEVHLYARNFDKVKSALDKGAIKEESMESLVQNVDVVCTMVGLVSDVREVYDEIFKYVKVGQTCIDFTTSSPELAKELYQKGKEIGVHILDAPVTGGDVGAKNGTLTILVGADTEDFEKMYSIFDAFSGAIHYCGNAGSGQYVKIANQIMIANNLQGICEAIQYLNSKDIDENLIITCLKNGAAGSKQLDLNGQKMLDKDYEPGFYVKHFIKDLNIALDRKTIPLTGVENVVKEYLELVDKGYNEKGTQCLIEYFR